MDPSGIVLDQTEEPMDRVRRRSLSRRLWGAGLGLIVGAAGIAAVTLAFRIGDANTPLAVGDAICESHNDPGLITCEEAVRRAVEEEGSAGVQPTGARLSWYAVNPESEERQVWIVNLGMRQVPVLGPPGNHPTCFIDDWEAVIDAVTGEFLVAGNAGASRPCDAST